MNFYHITWLISENPILSTGKSYEAFSMLEALSLFNKEFPGKEPLYILKTK